MSNSGYCFWEQWEDEIIKKHYNLNHRTQEILPFLNNRSVAAIKGRAKYLGLTRNVYFTKNENYFEIPNIRNCVIAGEFAADGYIREPSSKISHMITFCKCGNDTSYLEKIKKELSCTTPIHSYLVNSKLPSGKIHKGLQSTLSIAGAKKWVEDLRRHWNITPRKSLTLEAPNLTDDLHIIAFYLGYFFGDGSIFLGPNSNCPTLTCQMDIIGTLELCNFFKSFFDSLFSLGDCQILQKGKIFIYKLQSSRVYYLTKIIESMDISDLYFDRKVNKMIEFRKYIDEQRKLHHLRDFQLRNTPTPKLIKIFNRLNITSKYFPTSQVLCKAP